MTFRTRLLVIFLVTVLLPIVALALFIRGEMTDRLAAQYERRVESLVGVIEDDLSQESETIAGSILALREGLVDDNRFRRAAVDRVESERRYLLDYAGHAMKLTGLSMLQIQDESGRVLSSGHFRNEYDRLEPALPRLLASAPDGTALVEARAPDAPFLALARLDSLELGGKRFTIVAGVRVGPRFLKRLAREGDLSVALVYPGGLLAPDTEGPGPPGKPTPRETEPSVDAQLRAFQAPPALPPGSAIVREVSVPFVDMEHGALSVARFRITHDLAELHTLRRSIDRWFLVAVVATGLLSVVIVSWLASRISRPLVELADKTSRVDLDRLDVDFDSRRRDEIGVLSRVLEAMTERLRVSAVLIKDAERRATVGELARQVNHDIKNGLTPIRNVFRHLAELAANDPRQLAIIFQEREKMLDSSISYLENLASNYAKLSPRGERAPIDVNDIVRRVVVNLKGSARVDFRMDLGDLGENRVLGDPVSLRRVVENLLTNAIDSLESYTGSVVVSTELASGENGERWIRLAVADTGIGMGEDQLTRIFDDFYTTKEKGVGLGLSIVRRLVMDLGGTIRVESEKGRGSRFEIDLPVVGSAEASSGPAGTGE